MQLWSSYDARGYNLICAWSKAGSTCLSFFFCISLCIFLGLAVCVFLFSCGNCVVCSFVHRRQSPLKTGDCIGPGLRTRGSWVLRVQQTEARSTGFTISSPECFFNIPKSFFL